jgi:hypothetical protein
MAALLQRIMVSSDTRAALRAQGYRADYTVAMESGSLEPGTDAIGYGPLIQAEAESHDPANTEATIQAVVREMGRRLEVLQEDGGVDPAVRAGLTQTFVSSSPAPEKAGGKRAYAALIALVVAYYLILRIFVQRIPPRRHAPHRARARVRFQRLAGRMAG